MEAVLALVLEMLAAMVVKVMQVAEAITAQAAVLLLLVLLVVLAVKEFTLEAVEVQVVMATLLLPILLEAVEVAH